MGKGSAFRNQYQPQPMFRVGEVGSQGVLEITDILFTTSGSSMFSRDGLCPIPAHVLSPHQDPGAIVVEWNVREPDGVQAGAGMWDSHIRY